MIYLVLCSLIFLSYWMPWWAVSVVGLILGYMARSWIQAIVLSFTSYFIFWLVLAYHSDSLSSGLIGQQTIQMFHLSSPWQLYILTGLLGGTLCLSGAQLAYKIKISLRPKKVRRINQQHS